MAQPARVACAFPIGTVERSAWLGHMGATLEAAPLDEAVRNSLRRFFLQTSAYVIGKEAAEPEHAELASRWIAQRALDDAVSAIARDDDHEVLSLVPQFAARPSVYVGLLARMIRSGRAALACFVIDAVDRQPVLATSYFSGKTLLHLASGAGSVEVVRSLLQLGIDPNIQDRGGDTPLYCVANENASETGPELVESWCELGRM